MDMQCTLEKLGPEYLTVIIRDGAPLICSDDRPSFRTVQIQLTEAQRKELALRNTYSVGGKEYFEQISQAILEN